MRGSAAPKSTKRKKSKKESIISNAEEMVQDMYRKAHSTRPIVKQRNNESQIVLEKKTQLHEYIVSEEKRSRQESQRGSKVSSKAEEKPPILRTAQRNSEKGQGTSQINASPTRDKKQFTLNNFGINKVSANNINYKALNSGIPP